MTEVTVAIQQHNMSWLLGPDKTLSLLREELHFTSMLWVSIIFLQLHGVATQVVIFFIYLTQLVALQQNSWLWLFHVIGLNAKQHWQDWFHDTSSPLVDDVAWLWFVAFNSHTTACFGRLVLQQSRTNEIGWITVNAMGLNWFYCWHDMATQPKTICCVVWIVIVPLQWSSVNKIGCMMLQCHRSWLFLLVWHGSYWLPCTATPFLVSGNWSSSRAALKRLLVWNCYLQCHGSWSFLVLAWHGNTARNYWLCGLDCWFDCSGEGPTRLVVWCIFLAWHGCD